MLQWVFLLLLLLLLLQILTYIVRACVYVCVIICFHFSFVLFCFVLFVCKTIIICNRQATDMSTRSTTQILTIAQQPHTFLRRECIRDRKKERDRANERSNDVAFDFLYVFL